MRQVAVERNGRRDRSDRRSRPGQESNQGGKESTADDRPEDGKGRIADLDGEEIGKFRLSSQPGSQQGADKTEGDAGQAAAVRVTRDRLSQRTTNAGNQQQEQ